MDILVRCHHVGYQPFSALSVFLCQYCSIFHTCALPQLLFDFTQFNTYPMDLDLEIISAQVLNVAIRQPAGEIAGFIQTCIGLGAKGVGNKTLGVQFRAIKVTAGDLDTADMEFAGDAGWQRL
ncbi:hypothetical protein D3C71_1801460 [compost metagenome]